MKCKPAVSTSNCRKRFLCSIVVQLLRGSNTSFPSFHHLFPIQLTMIRGSKIFELPFELLPVLPESSREVPLLVASRWTLYLHLHLFTLHSFVAARKVRWWMRESRIPHQLSLQKASPCGRSAASRDGNAPSKPKKGMGGMGWRLPSGSRWWPWKMEVSSGFSFMWRSSHLGRMCSLWWDQQSFTTTARASATQTSNPLRKHFVHALFVLIQRRRRRVSKGPGATSWHGRPLIVANRHVKHESNSSTDHLSFQDLSRLSHIFGHVLGVLDSKWFEGFSVCESSKF